MNDEAKRRNAARYLHAANLLNYERGQMPEAYIVKRGKVVGFMPCEKAAVYLAALHSPTGYRPEPYQQPGLADMNDETPSTLVTARAALTPCACHSGLGESDLLEYEFGS